MSKIDLNRADVETLSRLNGIGDKLAVRIVTYRETVHPFEETIELAAVPGISERMVRALADQITVELPAPENDAPVVESRAEAAPLSRVMARDDIETPVLDPEVVPEEVSAKEIADAESSPKTAAAGASPSGDTPADVDVVLLAEAGEEDGMTGGESASRPEELQPPPQVRAPFLGHLVTALFAALVGAGLTLFLLYLLNGTLNFATPRQVTRLQREVAAQDEARRGLDEEVATVTTQMSRARAAEATIAAGLEETTGTLADLEREVVGDVTDLEAETDILATRVSGLSDAAQNFDLFLDGMRDLLIELRGLPPSPTATPILSATATVTATTAAGEGTSSPTPTPTPLATRTPRPTATPFVRPTATAVNAP